MVNLLSITIFLLLLSLFSQFSPLLSLGPFKTPLGCLYIGKGSLWGSCSSPRWAGASLGKLKLSVEAMSSPRRVGFFTMKLFCGLGKLEASLGELGSKKTKEKTFLPFFLVFFAFSVKTLNDHLFHTVTGIQHCKLTSKDQKINEW